MGVSDPSMSSRRDYVVPEANVDKRHPDEKISLKIYLLSLSTLPRRIPVSPHPGFLTRQQQGEGEARFSRESFIKP